MSKVDRSHGGVYKKGEEPDDLLYWLSRPPAERLKALEEIRQEYNIKTKLATGRPQDKVDAAKLTKKKGK